MVVRQYREAASNVLETASLFLTVAAFSCCDLLFYDLVRLPVGSDQEISAGRQVAQLKGNLAVVDRELA